MAGVGLQTAGYQPAGLLWSAPGSPAMTPQDALRESRERLQAEAGADGAAYRQLANKHRRGEIEREVAARLAARGLGPDGADLATGKKPTGKRS